MEEYEEELEVEYEEYNPLAEKENKIERMKGIIFLIWFILSIIIFIVAAEFENGYLVTINLGQYFLVFGIGAYTSSKEKITLIAPTVGLGCIAVPLILMFKPEEVNTEILISILVLIALFIVGLALIIIPLISYYKKLKKYSVTVPATILFYDESINNGSNITLYAPNYRYNYNGKEYKIKSNKYSNKKVLEGSSVKIKIDPNNPSILYERSLDDLLNLIVPLFIGIIILLVPVGIVTYFMINIRKFY